MVVKFHRDKSRRGQSTSNDAIKNLAERLAGDRKSSKFGANFSITNGSVLEGASRPFCVLFSQKSQVVSLYSLATGSLGSTFRVQTRVLIIVRRRKQTIENEYQRTMNQEEHRNEEPAAEVAPAAEETEPELPPSQKLVRTADPDLQIIFKGASQDDEEEEGAERTFMCHSIIMAAHSGYFDALLSSEMKEAAEKKVIFDDVSPKVFEKAMELLEDPLASHDLGAQEALFVASFYNRFEVPVGRKLVNSILGKFLDHWTETTTKVPPRQEKDLLIQTVLFAQESSSPELLQKSAKVLKVKFCQKDACGMGLFEVEDMKRLHHFLPHEGRECVEEFYNKWWATDLDEDEMDELLQDSKFPSSLSFCFVDLLTDAFCRKIKLSRIKVTIRGTKGTFPDPQQELTMISKKKSSFLAGNWQFQGSYSSSNMFVALGRVDPTEDTFISTLWANSTSHREKVRDRHMGDWMLHFEFEGHRYNFIFPMSRNQSLPPLGDGWVQVYDDDSPDNDEGRLFQNPTVQLEYIFGDD